MQQRKRTYYSQSFALTQDQLDWLYHYAEMASVKLGTKVSMSEIIRMLIDNATTEQSSNRGTTNNPIIHSETISPSIEPPHLPVEPNV